jgi:hypothetical protein
MSNVASAIRRLINGSTTVPEFTGHPWRETSAIAVSHRVVRHAVPTIPRSDGGDLGDWVIVAQEPLPGRRVAIDSVVTLLVHPQIPSCTGQDRTGLRAVHATSPILENAGFTRSM